ncbi:hypothetical protein F2P81_001424 [Scophthalmus maximus]|uniref:Uncharacterized protein n=1 Tax=Scophthalmus maximus TaxID=52904 RepID=A0A6A4TI26_SCOMX|nr:hypothetical protein F2P81_001424 [Scophthalmus maximus]
MENIRFCGKQIQVDVSCFTVTCGRLLATERPPVVPFVAIKYHTSLDTSLDTAAQCTESYFSLQLRPEDQRTRGPRGPPLQTQVWTQQPSARTLISAFNYGDLLTSELTPCDRGRFEDKFGGEANA